MTPAETPNRWARVHFGRISTCSPYKKSIMGWKVSQIPLGIPCTCFWSMLHGRMGKKLPHFKSHQPATLIIIWHKWEDRSRKVSMNAFNFSPTPWNFWPVMSQAVRKPCFSTSIPRGQNPRFPDAAGAACGQTLKSRSRPLPTHPGMKYFRKGDPRCWLWSTRL